MDDRSREYLPHSSWCFMCGDENACGVRARFYVEDGAVRARVTLSPHHNGYKGVAHGGVLAALLDEPMGWAATVFGGVGTLYVTGELTVKYLAPVPVSEEVEVACRLVRDAGRIAYISGELKSGGSVKVKAEGKFFPMAGDQSRRILSSLKYDGCRKYRSLRPGGDAGDSG